MKRPRLVSNWRAILRRAWSVRWMYGATLLGGFEVVLPVFQDAIPRWPFAVLSLLAVLLGIVSRVIEQQELSGKHDA